PGLGQDLEALQLVDERQPVAALGLDRRRAELEEALETDQEQREERLGTRRADAAHAREDAAAGLGDLEVGLALRAQLELVLARAGEDRVRVGVDEARDERAAARVQRGGRRVGGAQLGLRADGGDALALDRDGAARQDPDPAELRSPARARAEGGGEL